MMAELLGIQSKPPNIHTYIIQINIDESLIEQREGFY